MRSTLAAALLAMITPLSRPIEAFLKDAYPDVVQTLRNRHRTSATGIMLTATRRGAGISMATQKRAALKKRNRARHKARC